MAYVYLNDDGPESEDYESNYFYFDENNREALALIEDLLASDADRDEDFREKLNRLCESSFEKKTVKSKGKVINLLKEFSKLMIPSIAFSKSVPECAFKSAQECAQN